VSDSTTPRDRDELGRARNARPRDATGRPLPHGATAADGAVEPVADDLALPPVEMLREAQRLLDVGRAFAAHEVLEAAWKSAPDAERSLWQGLAQVAVGLTHVQRGNLRGAVELLRRGSERVRTYAAAPPHGIDAGAVVDWADALVERLAGAETGVGVDPMTLPPLRLSGAPRP